MTLVNRDGRPVAEATFRVRFAETDAMGVVHHAAYVVYFEEGRSEYSRQAGAPYADLEAMGFSLAVSEVRARYLAPAVYDQAITVRTWVERIGSRGVTFAYEVVAAGSQQVLVTGQTRHICVDRQGRVSRIPERWLAVLMEGAGLT
ncbi:MAG: thioesterase family protein [Anaerolineae bacterium]